MQKITRLLFGLLLYQTSLFSASNTDTLFMEVFGKPQHLLRTPHEQIFEILSATPQLHCPLTQNSINKLLETSSFQETANDVQQLHPNHFHWSLTDVHNYTDHVTHIPTIFNSRYAKPFIALIKGLVIVTQKHTSDDIPHCFRSLESFDQHVCQHSRLNLPLMALKFLENVDIEPVMTFESFSFNTWATFSSQKKIPIIIPRNFNEKSQIENIFCKFCAGDWVSNILRFVREEAVGGSLLAQPGSYHASFSQFCTMFMAKADLHVLQSISANFNPHLTPQLITGVLCSNFWRQNGCCYPVGVLMDKKSGTAMAIKLMPKTIFRNQAPNAVAQATSLMILGFLVDFHHIRCTTGNQLLQSREALLEVCKEWLPAYKSEILTGCLQMPSTTRDDSILTAYAKMAFKALLDYTAAHTHNGALVELIHDLEQVFDRMLMQECTYFFSLQKDRGLPLLIPYSMGKTVHLAFPKRTALQGEENLLYLIASLYNCKSHWQKKIVKLEDCSVSMDHIPLHIPTQNKLGVA